MNDTTAETAAGPIGPDTPNTPPPPSKPNHMERHMSRIEAVGLLMALAKKRSMSEDQVTALQMGAGLMMTKHFQLQRNWARRRARVEGETVHDPATGTGGMFFTPPAALDAILANPPLPTEPTENQGV